MTAHLDTFCRDNLPPIDSWPDFVFDRPELRYPDRLNAAAELLDHHDADRPCLLTPSGERWSYGEVRETVNRIANVLAELGIVPGNRVLLRGPNTPYLVLNAGTLRGLIRRRRGMTVGEVRRSRPSW